jgi:ADP-ribose pyrophosphatase
MSKPIVPREIQKIFQGRVFTVQIEIITLPKGGEMKAEIVQHPGSVVIVPVTAAGELVLVRQYRPAIGRWVWELPAGTLKDGENPEKAAIRECHEEIGLIPALVEKLGAFFPTPGYCDEEMHFYRATGLRPPGSGDEAAQRDEDEDIELQTFPLNTLRAMIGSGEVIDLKTVAGLALLDAPPAHTRRGDAESRRP